jgi:acetoin utilization deacetylase AcuC-like enzyme
MRVFWDETQLSHDPRFFLVRGQVRRFLEVPARALALLEGARAAGLEVTRPPPGDLDAAIRRVHTEEYLAFLADAPALWAALPDAGPELVPSVHPMPEMLAEGAARPVSVVGALGWHTADTSCAMTADTWPAARAAAACAVAAADEAAAGRHAYALCRPPGHHAYPARAGGHCYLNNAAIAAEHLRARGAARVGILDIDAHHGNGTQHVFWERDDVLVASVHGDPDGYYPWYVGRADERGDGAGAGCNLNRPLPRGAGDAVWLAAIDDAVTLLRRGAVTALVVSLGFDASVDEPLNFLAVTPDGFARAGAAVAGLRCPVALVQEGGYAVDRLGALLRAFLEGFGCA